MENISVKQLQIKRNVLPRPPFRMGFIARSQMGKTTLAVKLLSYKWIHEFNKVYIFCSTYAEDSTWSIFDEHVNSGKVEVFTEFKENQIRKLWNIAKKRHIENKNYKTLFYFDDFGAVEGFKSNSDTGVLNELSSRGNHSGISLIYVVQKFTQTSVTVRLNTEAFVIFFTQQKNELDHMYNEFGIGKRKEFEEMLQRSTAIPYSTFYVNRQGPGAPDYYENFKKIKINPK